MKRQASFGLVDAERQNLSKNTRKNSTSNKW
jgi:hypothetical protein